MNYAVERFVSESIKDQPFNTIGQFAEQNEGAGYHSGGEKGSNAGEAGSGTKSGGA